MRHALMLAAAAAGLAAATPADAQSYLNWPGRPAPAARNGAASGPTGLIPHAGVQPLSNPVGDAVAAIPDRRPARGLTPASAWLPGRAEPASPQPVRTAMAAPASPPAAPPAVEPPPALPRPAQPRPTPVQPTPAPPPAAAPTAAPAYDPADPMAPRGDALIFRMGRDTPDPAPVPAAASASAQAPAAQPVRPSAYAPPPAASTLGSRRYSVHRQNGQQPDAIQRPEPVYLDALPVDLTETPQSEDLAAPPAPPSMMRNADGRYVPAPAAVEHDVQ